MREPIRASGLSNTPRFQICREPFSPGYCHRSTGCKPAGNLRKFAGDRVPGK